MAIKATTIEGIKARPLSLIVEALGGTLKKVGHEFVTECLWHDDTNPSLTINDDKSFGFCHVCRAHCDAISYVRERNGLGMRDATEIAAEVLGVPFETDEEDPEEARKRRAERTSAISRLNKEQATYKANIRDPRAGRVREILKARGIGAEAAKEFGIGFGSSGFFSGRITLPIYNHREELVGFTGRATKQDQQAKYKNSADSNLFQKKEIVFNEPRARRAAREAGSLIFVEGHLDVVSMWQAGIKNVVAMQGTAAPDENTLRRLVRHTRSFILCFDGDAGGKKAAEVFIGAAGPMAMQGECSITVTTLPEGSDPDEVIRNGEDLYKYISDAPNWLDWVIDSWAADLDKTDTSMVIAVERKLNDLIKGLKSKALRTHYIDKAARVLSSDAKEAKKIADNWSSGGMTSSNSHWKRRDLNETRLVVERRLVRNFIHFPESRDALRPIMEALRNPALRWLSMRLQELEDCSSIDLTPHSVMAVVAVAEPHYMDQLRPLIRPRVVIDNSEGMLRHMKDVMMNEAALFQCT